MSTALNPAAASTVDSTVQPGSVRRRELAAFLRSRRERITPEEVGLPHTGRRRTPGLRREEVAQLAGVGVTWYTWLEQGRDIRASEQVLKALAKTLRLDAYEHAHLSTLAGLSAPPPGEASPPIPPGVHVILRQLEPIPAIVTNARMDILAYNRAYDWLLGVDDIPFEDRNTLVQCFLSDRWRACMPDWEGSVARLVAQVRAAMAQRVADPAWKALVKRLRRESAEFEALWTTHDVQPPRHWTKRFQHPEAGMLRFETTYLWLTPGQEIRLTTYTPADEETAAKLAGQRS